MGGAPSSLSSSSPSSHHHHHHHHHHFQHQPTSTIDSQAALIARSASHRVSQNQSCPSLQCSSRSLHRKLATVIRTKWCMYLAIADAAVIVWLHRCTACDVGTQSDVERGCHQITASALAACTQSPTAHASRHRPVDSRSPHAARHEGRMRSAATPACRTLDGGWYRVCADSDKGCTTTTPGSACKHPPQVQYGRSKSSHNLLRMMQRIGFECLLTATD